MGRSQTSRRFYPHLESLRGVAALCVVLFHAFGNRSPQPELFANPTPDAIANLILTSIFGGTGTVTLFFVLSGFVLAESRPTYNVSLYLDELRKDFDRAFLRDLAAAKAELKQQMEAEAQKAKIVF